MDIQKVIDKYPDENVPRGNCYEYVFYKLGFDVEKVGQLPVISDFFDEVASAESADAIGFQMGDNRYYHHLAYREQPSGIIKHRENIGLPVYEVNIEDLHEMYDPSRMVYLRLKDHYRTQL